jgi:hypothetical protein
MDDHAVLASPTPESQEPTFCRNPDNVHCLQACVKMILETAVVSGYEEFDALDRLTGKRNGLWTWPACTLVEMKNLGFEVRYVTDFDYDRFSREGESYLYEWYSPSEAKSQVQHSDVPYEQGMAATLVEHITMSSGADFNTASELLSEGFLLIANVNWKALYDRIGYTGHYVLVYRIDDGSVTYHDPGKPARPSHTKSFLEFDRGWQEGGRERDRSIMGFRWLTR